MDDFRESTTRITDWPIDGQLGPRMTGATSPTPSQQNDTSLATAFPLSSSDYILHPSRIEDLARQLMTKRGAKNGQSNESAAAPRYIIHASAAHGSSWFKAGDFYQRINPGACPALPTGFLDKLKESGLIIHRQMGRAHELRINVPNDESEVFGIMVPKRHLHGQDSLQIMNSFEKHFQRHRNSGPLPLLLLVGIHHLRHRRGTVLREYAAPHQSFDVNTSTVSRLLMDMAKEGVLIDLNKNHSHEVGVMVGPVKF